MSKSKKNSANTTNTLPCIGVDVGTMNLCASRFVEDKQVEFQLMRNMFLEVSPDVLAIQELVDTGLDYVLSKDEDGEVERIYILGEDAFKFSQIFGQPVKRPMQTGVISTQDINAIDILTLMMEKLVGKATSDDSVCVYSVPANAVDQGAPPVLYHEKVFSRIFRTLGYDPHALNESLAIIFSECSQSKFSGIAISFGSGLTNVAVAYKGTPAMQFSVARAGDWIDKSVAESVGVIQSRVTSIKERDLDLMNPNVGKKKERIIREALVYYYNNLIEYVIEQISNKFNEDSEGLEIDEEIPLVISGGTSMPKNFIEFFKEVFSQVKDFPYEISEIRHAKDPLTAVSYGCLIKAAWIHKKKQEEAQ